MRRQSPSSLDPGMGEGLAGCPLKLHASIHEGERRPRVGAFLIGSDAVHPLKPVVTMGEGAAGYLAGFHRHLRVAVPASSAAALRGRTEGQG
jgi:hypothetical protein